MKKFEGTVVRDGKRSTGILMALCLEEAREKLLAEGFQVISLREVRTKKGMGKNRVKNIAMNFLVGLGLVLMMILIWGYFNNQNTDGKKTTRHDAYGNPSEWIDIERYISRSNRGVKKIREFTSKKSVIRINFAMDDWGAKEKTQTGARKDIYGMLRAISVSNYKYNAVTITGTFPLVDKIGKTRETEVVIINFDKPGMEKIDWNNFPPEQVYYKARSFWMHDDFK